MIIDAAACEWMKLSITTEPATTPTDWEASIDEGTTWVSAQDVGGLSGWLVAGPDYAGVSTPDFTTALGVVKVKVRLIDLPETIIAVAPRIDTQVL